ncbi:MAG: hydroxyisourate hydrolase [Pseudolabrys sp.]
MPGISIHVVDVSRGVIAAGMRVELHVIADNGEPALLVQGAIGAKGLLEKPELAATFKSGAYAALFHVGEYYREAGVNLPVVPFLDVVYFHFGIADPAQHYHLPFKCTPWGYSCFRGGA